MLIANVGVEPLHTIPLGCVIVGSVAPILNIKTLSFTFPLTGVGNATVNTLLVVNAPSKTVSVEFFSVNVPVVGLVTNSAS